MKIKSRKGEILIGVAAVIAATALAVGILYLCLKVGGKIDGLPDWFFPTGVIVVAVAVVASLYKRIKG